MSPLHLGLPQQGRASEGPQSFLGARGLDRSGVLFNLGLIHSPLVQPREE